MGHQPSQPQIFIKNNNNGCLKALLVLFFIAVLGMGGCTFLGMKGCQIIHTDINDRAKSQDALAGKLEITDFVWSRSSFGSIMDATFTIKNHSEHAAQNISILCVQYSQDGTEMDRNTRKIYATIPAGRSKTFKDHEIDFISSDVHNAEVTIESALLAD